MMQPIELNGKKILVKASSLTELLNELELSIATVLVEQNGLALLRHELETAPLNIGDQIEILKVVAGG